MRKNCICQRRLPLKLVHSERAFILPFSLFLLLIFTSVTIHAAVKYEVEKKFFQATKNTYQIEAILYNATVDLKNELIKNKDVEEGVFEYENGYANYSVIERINDESLKLSIQCFTKQNGKLTVTFTYHLPTQEITHWEEN